jgi:hypothetical protein
LQYDRTQEWPASVKLQIQQRSYPRTDLLPTSAIIRGFEDRPLMNQERRSVIVYDMWGRINKARKEDSRVE